MKKTLHLSVLQNSWEWFIEKQLNMLAYMLYNKRDNSDTKKTCYTN